MNENCNNSTNYQGGQKYQGRDAGVDNRTAVTPDKVGIKWNSTFESMVLNTGLIHQAIQRMLLEAGLNDIGAVEFTKVFRQHGEKQGRIQTTIDIYRAKGIIEEKKKSLFSDNTTSLSRNFINALRNKAYGQRLNFFFNKKKLIIEWDTVILLAFLTNTKYDSDSYSLMVEPVKKNNNKDKKQKGEQPVNIIISRHVGDIGFHWKQVADMERYDNCKDRDRDDD